MNSATTSPWHIAMPLGAVHPITEEIRVDATIIASQTERDDEARWLKHRGKKAVHGFKAHVGADASTDLVERLAITPANVNDGRAGPDALPDDPRDVFADSAYRGSHFRQVVQSRGGRLRVAETAIWGRDEKEALARLKAWNDDVHRTAEELKKFSERGSAVMA